MKPKHMIMIIEELLVAKERWLTSGELSNLLSMGYRNYKLAREELIKLKLILEREGRLANQMAYKINY